jgi:hypothetical protein
MLNKIVTAALISCCAAAMPAAATAATFLGVRQVGSDTVNLSITTDKVGVLSSSDITDFSVAITRALNTVTLSSSSGAVATIFGNAFTATDTGLFFNFDASAPSYFIVQQGGFASGQPYYCIETASCTQAGEFLGSATGGFETSAPGGVLTPLSASNGPMTLPQTGIQQIAAVSGVAVVPEPATWAMMIGGFAMVGGAMRSARRKQKVRVTYI